MQPNDFVCGPSGRPSPLSHNPEARGLRGILGVLKLNGVVHVINFWSGPGRISREFKRFGRSDTRNRFNHAIDIDTLVRARVFGFHD